MPIYNANSTKNKADIYIDNKAMQKVYCGDKLVWQKYATVTLNNSSVLFCDSNNPGRVYFYDPAGGPNAPRIYVPGIPSYTGDIAHTSNKLWVNGYLEYNITLNPFTATLNRQINSGNFSAPGLCAINDTTLIGITGTGVWEINITSDTAVNTLKFTLPAGRQVLGDFILTTTGKFLVTTSNSSYLDRKLSQYNYSTGALEVEISIDGYSGYGLFQYDNEIYFTSGPSILKVQKTAPYTISFIRDVVLAGAGVSAGINGASQNPAYLTAHLIP